MSLVISKIKNVDTNSWWSKDNNLLFVLLFFASFLIYFVPQLITRFVFLFFLVLAYRSNKDYLWIAFLFILLETPGGFFYGGILVDQHRVPLYTIVPGISLRFEEFFIMAFLFKAFSKKSQIYFTYKRDMLKIFCYIFFLLGYSFLLGMSENNLIITVRYLMPWGLIFALPRLLRSDKSFIKLCKLLFPFVYIALIFQFYEMKTGLPIVSLVKKEYYIFSQISKVSQHQQYAARVLISPMLIFFCFFTALFFLKSKSRYFPRWYLAGVIICSSFMVFISATRGWIIAFTFMFLAGLVVGTKSKTKMIFRFVGGMAVGAILILTLVLKSSSIYTIQIDRAFERLKTMYTLLEGDPTAQGTLIRLSERGPRVMMKFWESPVFGWGFSNEYHEYKDVHVGNQTLLLNVGLVGFILVFSFLFKFCKNVVVINKKLNQRNLYKDSLLIIVIMLIGYIIIHSSSGQLIGFQVLTRVVVLFCLVLSFSDCFLRKTLNIKKLK